MDLQHLPIAFFQRNYLLAYRTYNTCFFEELNEFESL